MLDDRSPLRQLNPGMETARVRRFTPEDAVRVRRNTFDNTPLLPETPHALNPPDGVIVDYWLGASPAGDITLDVLDATGHFVRDAPKAFSHDFEINANPGLTPASHARRPQAKSHLQSEGDRSPWGRFANRFG